MRAVLLREFGGPEQLRLGEAPDPAAGPGQVRIAVHAAGINPVDAGNRADGAWARLQVPCVSHVLPLAAAAEAHRMLESRHAGGKIVLDVASG